MNLKDRVEKLEDLIGVTGEIPPLIRIDIQDCSGNTDDEGTPAIGIIPGKPGGLCGFTLLRAEDETGANFLKRCEAKHSNFYRD